MVPFFWDQILAARVPEDTRPCPGSKELGVRTSFQPVGDLKDSDPGTHPSVEAVTRATLFASGTWRATLELAIFTVFLDWTQPPSSRLAFCMERAGYVGFRVAQGRRQ